MAHIKDHSALSGLPKRGIHFARFDLFVAKPGIDMGIDITRPELAGYELTQWALSVIDSKVDHDRDICDRSRFDSAFNRRPFRAGVMGGLDAYDQTLIAKRHVRRGLGLHVCQILLKLSAPH